MTDQILTVAQMREAEDALIAGGTSVDDLMQVAGRGAAEWVWRLAGHHRVTVLCGPGNNGGDGYVIAEAIRERGGKVAVVAASEPGTDAARNARAAFRGEVLPPSADVHGDCLVDCLFGSGLTRPLSEEHFLLLTELARHHRHRVAVDLPSGVQSDNGIELNADLPRYDLTIALGAWKFAHFLMPACAAMGAMRLVPIGVEPVAGAVQVLAAPR
ncbi:MAG: NAD(P)H-hydrate epimerase, partial [Novosphingobium sp.]|nr:NAD(P)H-hydrate epimerase [Novosphingobium sp.]